MKNKKRINKKDRKIIKRVLSYIGRQKMFVCISFIFALLSTIATLYIPIVVGDAIDCAIGQGNVDFESLIKKIILIGAVALTNALITWLMSNCNNKITYYVARDIRNDAFTKICHVPQKFLDEHTSGEIVNRVIVDVDTFSEGLLMGTSQLMTGFLTIIGTILFMMSVKPVITLVVVLITPLSLIVSSLISKKTFLMFKQVSKIKAMQTSLIDETVGNLDVVRAFSKEKDLGNRFDEINNELKACSFKATYFSSLVNPSTRVVNAIVYAGVGISGALLSILTGNITVGQLSCFLNYANQYTKPFNEISGVIAELQNALACAERVFDLIDEPDEVNDGMKEVASNGCVDIENVDFSYSEDRPLIKNFNLSVEKGQKIAIVGPTGCGKTTFINLLMRFYDVCEGKILVSGTDIREINRQKLRKMYGMVLQDTWIRKGTVKENICMGKPGASDEEIVAAATAAHAHGFIMRMENGYDTVIGDGAESLSQGQKQLLCIARVMLLKPSMLILDEATSSIDTRTEVKVQEAFLKLMEGRTSFIVAHRLSTIKSADMILVMKDGDIIEKGNHNELIQKDGFYAKMYNSRL